MGGARPQSVGPWRHSGSYFPEGRLWPVYEPTFQPVAERPQTLRVITDTFFLERSQRSPSQRRTCGGRYDRQPSGPVLDGARGSKLCAPQAQPICRLCRRSRNLRKLALILGALRISRSTSRAAISNIFAHNIAGMTRARLCRPVSPDIPRRSRLAPGSVPSSRQIPYCLVCVTREPARAGTPRV